MLTLQVANLIVNELLAVLSFIIRTVRIINEFIIRKGVLIN